MFDEGDCFFSVVLGWQCLIKGDTKQCLIKGANDANTDSGFLEENVAMMKEKGFFFWCGARVAVNYYGRRETVPY